MTRSIFLTLTTVLLLTVNASIGAPAPAATNDVRAVRAAWNDAFNAGDIDRLIALYTEDAVSMPPGAAPNIGRAAIKTDIGAFLAAHTVRETVQIQDIMIQGDMAVERADYDIQITPRTGQPFAEHGKHIVAYRRGPDGKWRIKFEIWNSNVPEKK